MPDRPLDGLVVLDTTDEKGALCGRILADLGARVVLVEPPGGDPSRCRAPLAPDGVSSLSFAYRNANKRGVTLDLGRPEGLEVFGRLLDRADVWLETSPPGAAPGPGLEPSGVAERHPMLVVTSITDFGRTGPYRDWVGTDMVGFAMGGLLSRSGLPDRPPLVAPGAMAYDVTAATAAYATLVAYWQRLRTGLGQHLDVSVMESVAAISDWSIPMASFLGQGFSGLRSGPGPAYPAYPCADGWVRLIVLSPRSWRALREWLGNPEVLMDDVFDQLLYRTMAADIIEPLVVELFRDFTKTELAVEGQRRGISIAPLLTPPEVLANEHFASRGTFVDAEVLPGVSAPVASGFFWFDGHQHGFRHRAPAPGEHTDEVLGELAGLAGAEVAELRARGVV